jgi:hypothetical protein
MLEFWNAMEDVNMSRSVKHRSAQPLFRARNLVTLASASLLVPWLLAGCVVQPARVYYPPPPPPPAYSPPPAAYTPPPADYSQPQPDYSQQPPADDATAETASEPPPPLPDYDQPPCPDDGYMWTPGYWHWSPAGYYWVPGTWVQPPQVGLLWTPGYWGFIGGVYAWHGGYWGPHVGYYGGVNYGFGYVGVGYLGGRWEGNRFAYNTAVNRVNTTVIHNTYNTTVINNVTINKVSYNGGPGGVAAQPNPQERSFARESHVPPTSMQVSHVQEARGNPALFAKANGGHPAIAATPRPAAFTGPGVVGARGATTSPLIQNFNRPTGNANPGTPQPPHPGPTGAGARVPPPGQPQPQVNAAHPPSNVPPQQPAVGNRAYVGKPQAQLNQAPPPKGNSNGSGGKPPPHPNDKQHEGEGGNREH